MSLPLSPLSFLGFKIDTINLKVQGSVDLVRQGTFESAQWSYRINLRQPIFFKKASEYAGGIDFSMAYFAKDTEEKDKKSENALVELSIAIVGIFKAENLDKELEQKLIKTNIPFILMPHLRAAISNIFASSGYGTITVPLINTIALAEQKFANVEIEIRE